jgi:hypothetical protein
LEGNGGSGENTTRHLIFWHHEGERRRSRGARGGHSSNIGNDRPPGLASPKRGARGKEHNRMADGTSTTPPRRNMMHTSAIVVGTDNKPSKTFIRKPS